MRLLKQLSVALFAGVLATGCASVAHIEKDDTANFTAYKTYAWTESSENKEAAKPQVHNLTDSKIKEAVNAELVKQGWREVKSKPDVLLSYDVLVERAIREQSNPVYTMPYTRYLFNPYSRRWVPIFYPSQFAGFNNNAFQVREGTVTITMVDTKTEKTVWQGWTTNQINSRNMTGKEIQNSVKSIFRKFDTVKK